MTEPEEEPPVPKVRLGCGCKSWLASPVVSTTWTVGPDATNVDGGVLLEQETPSAVKTSVAMAILRKRTDRIQTLRHIAATKSVSPLGFRIENTRQGYRILTELRRKRCNFHPGPWF